MGKIEERFPPESNLPKILLWLLIITVGLVLYFGNLPELAVAIILFYTLIILIVYDVNKRFSRIYKTLDSLDSRMDTFADTERRFYRLESATNLADWSITIPETEQLPRSHKVDLVLSPNWEEILDKLSEKKEWTEFLARTQENREAMNYGIGQEEHLGPLWGKAFRFVIFVDAISGIRQIWSDYHKTFVDEEKVKGYIFLTSVGEEGKLESENGSNRIILTPNSAGFHTVLPEWVPSIEISKIPYSEIIRLFRDIKRFSGYDPCYAIKEFPEELKKEFEKNNVKYELFDFENHGVPAEFNKGEFDDNENENLKKIGVKFYDQEMKRHWFSTPYYSVGIALEFFD